MNTQVMFSSETDNWETPQGFFDQLNARFGFTLDPCADAQNHKCDRYFTREDDGLKQDWSGNIVFCNPPYGREIGKWVKKCYDESQNPKTVCVMLIPARTDTKWFHDYIYGKAQIEFVRGRLKFGGGGSAPFPSMIVIFNNQNDKGATQ